MPLKIENLLETGTAVTFAAHTSSEIPTIRGLRCGGIDSPWPRKCPNCNPFFEEELNPRPLPIRIAVRDVYDAPSSAIQEALARLDSIVGYKFGFVFSWDDIYRDLASSFPDASVLVPSICEALTTYLNRIIALLDEEKFQDAFLEKTSRPASRDIYVTIGESGSTAASHFDKSERWTIVMPKAGPNSYRQMSTSLAKGLETFFLTGGTNPTPKATASGNLAKQKTAGDWVDVSPSADNEAKVISLPALSTLGKPESLFVSLVPYYVVVTTSGARIHIESSHQPTLELVHDYLSKSTRRNMNLTTQVSPLVLVG